MQSQISKHQYKSRFTRFSFCFQVFISYIEVLNEPAKRQEELQQTYYFLCQCPICLDTKCLDEMLCIICPNTNCGASISVQNLKKYTQLNCNKCSSKLTDEFVCNYKEVMDFTYMQLQNMKQLACILLLNYCNDLKSLNLTLTQIWMFVEYA